MIVGLSGYARSGKDEAAKILVANGWERRAFADKLREFLYRLNPVVVPRLGPAFGPFTSYTTVQAVIDEYGWDGYKETPWGPHIREYAQRLGTECGRELISDTIWIDAALGPDGPIKTMILEPKIVVTDVRFPNEAAEIVRRGGMIIRITRPGVTAANAHVSERALDDWNFDAVVRNDKSINILHDRVRRAVALYFN